MVAGVPRPELDIESARHELNNELWLMSASSITPRDALGRVEQSIQTLARDALLPVLRQELEEDQAVLIVAALLTAEIGADDPRLAHSAGGPLAVELERGSYLLRRRLVPSLPSTTVHLPEDVVRFCRGVLALRFSALSLDAVRDALHDAAAGLLKRNPDVPTDIPEDPLAVATMAEPVRLMLAPRVAIRLCLVGTRDDGVAGAAMWIQALDGSSAVEYGYAEGGMFGWHLDEHGREATIRMHRSIEGVVGTLAVEEPGDPRHVSDSSADPYVLFQQLVRAYCNAFRLRRRHIDPGPLDLI
jgi:hypothetical protein